MFSKEYTGYDIATYRGYKFEQLMTVSDKGVSISTSLK